MASRQRFTWLLLSCLPIVPLAWVSIVTLTGGWIKIFSADPRLGFLSHARWLEGFVGAGQLPPGVRSLEAARHMILNDRLDAAVAAFFMGAVLVVLFESIRAWVRILSGRIPATTTEVKFSHTREYLIDAVNG